MTSPFVCPRCQQRFWHFKPISKTEYLWVCSNCGHPLEIELDYSVDMRRVEIIIQQDDDLVYEDDKGKEHS